MIYALLLWDVDGHLINRILDLSTVEAAKLEERLDVLVSGFEDSNGSLNDYELVPVPQDHGNYDDILKEVNYRFARKRTILIAINGKSVQVDKPVLTYEEIVAMAGMKGNPTAVYTNKREGGQLYNGKSIKLVDGMIIDVCHTNNA